MLGPSPPKVAPLDWYLYWLASDCQFISQCLSLLNSALKALFKSLSGLPGVKGGMGVALLLYLLVFASNDPPSKRSCTLIEEDFIFAPTK